jgi:glycerol uptake facilitator protein
VKNTLVSRLGSEVLGTLFFVFLGAGAVVTASSERMSPVTLGTGVAWALALIVAVWIFSAGGGHLNPFVTVGLALRGRFAWSAVPGHVIAQLVGGLAGALLAWWVFSSLGSGPLAVAATRGGADAIGILAAEALATLVLVAVVFRLIDSGGAMYGLGYGLAYGIGVLAILPLSGGSMNFARTFGAELSLAITGDQAEWANLWLYLVGPLVGVVLAWLLYPLFGGTTRTETTSR